MLLANQLYVPSIKLLFLFSFFALLACSGDSDPDITPAKETIEENQEPTVPELNTRIDGISPINGPKTTVLTINGADFGTDMGAVTVTINKREAEIQSLENNKIVVEVPARAYSGPVEVIIGGEILTGPLFTYLITEVEVTTISGTDAGYQDGTDPKFNFPVGIAVDPDLNLFIVDNENHRIRKYVPDRLLELSLTATSHGEVSTLAGSTNGFADGTGVNARFDTPIEVAIDGNGNVYVSDLLNHKIRKITPSGVVSTLAGSTQGYNDGMGLATQFNSPRGIAIDDLGNILVADSGNSKVRKISPDGEVSTLADTSAGEPYGITIGENGIIYVTVHYVENYLLRKINPDGTLETLAGGLVGSQDGNGTMAGFNRPRGLAIDPEGNVYMADTRNNRIRKILTDGTVTTLAGSILGSSDGLGAEAHFSGPRGLTIDSDYNIYVSDTGNHRIRKITQE